MERHDPSAGEASRREQRKSQTRLRLLRAAVELFVTDGYDETSYDDIAQRAGVARQTAFNHFRRKEDFVAAWVDQRRVELQEAIDRQLSREARSAMRLVLVMHVMTDIYERMPDEARALMGAWIRLGGPILDRPAAASIFATLVRDGQKSGEFVDDVDPDAVGEVIRAVYFDTLWRWADPSTPPQRRSLLGSMLTRVRIILTGLCSAEDRGTVISVLDQFLVTPASPDSVGGTLPAAKQ